MRSFGGAKQALRNYQWRRLTFCLYYEREIIVPPTKLYLKETRIGHGTGRKFQGDAIAELFATYADLTVCSTLVLSNDFPKAFCCTSQSCYGRRLCQNSRYEPANYMLTFPFSTFVAHLPTRYARVNVMLRSLSIIERWLLIQSSSKISDIRDFEALYIYIKTARCNKLRK
jgi:hypothetical protein